MANPAGESNDEVLKLDFDRRLMLQFRGSVVTSDAGLLAYRELDDALGLSTMAGEMLADARTGRNGRHALVGLLRQSVFGRLAGYEDVNDAERLRHDPGCAGLSAAKRRRAVRLRRARWVASTLAYNLGNFLRTLATPEPIKDWSLTSLKEKLIKIGAKVVCHGRYVAFQMAEVAIPRQMFQEILRLIAELRPQPPPAPA